MKKYIFLTLLLFFNINIFNMVKNQNKNIQKSHLPDKKIILQEVIIFLPKHITKRYIDDMYSAYKNKKIISRTAIAELKSKLPRTNNIDNIASLISQTKKNFEKIEYSIEFDFNDNNNTTKIILYIVDQQNALSHKEIIEKVNESIFNKIKNSFFKKIAFKIDYESKNWINFDFDLAEKRKFDRDFIDIIELLRKEQISFKDYLLLAKLTNNKKLFKAIVNSIYMLKLIIKIPVEQYSNNHEMFNVTEIQQDTLPMDVACIIIEFIDTESMADKKINFIPSKQISFPKNKIVPLPLNYTNHILDVKKQNQVSCEIL